MPSTVGFNIMLLKLSLDCLEKHLNTSDEYLILNLCKSVYIDFSRLIPNNPDDYDNIGTIDDIGSLSESEKKYILNFYETNMRSIRNSVAHTTNNIETDDGVVNYIRNCFFILESWNQINDIVNILGNKADVDFDDFYKNLGST